MIKPSPNLLDDLKLRYAEPQRAYHTWEHIEALLGHLDMFRSHIHDEVRVLWALYWHDAVYDPVRTDNETESARLLEADAKGILPDGILTEAAAIISATANHELPSGVTDNVKSDCAYFLDMDLSILGAPEPVFDEYEQNIRKEYSFVPIERYCQARSAIMLNFLKRRSLYFTEFGEKLWGESARSNLKRSIARLI